VLGILSLVCLGPLAGVPGIIVSVSARRSIREAQGRLGGGGMATAGLILSIIGTALAVIGIILIIIVAATGTSSSTSSTSTAVLGGASLWV
jgi:hypothetical protein